MAYTKSADGVAQKGKTVGKNLGDSGPTVSIEKGPAKRTVGKTNANMKAMGRNLARVANQKSG